MKACKHYTVKYAQITPKEMLQPFWGKLLYHFTNLSTNYLVKCKVYTDVGGIKQLYHFCPPVREIIHSLKLVDYLHVQADKPLYNLTYLLL